MRLSCAAVGIVFAVLALGQPAGRVYPGARLDPTETERARASSAANPEIEITVYTTPDPFEKVYGFFGKSGREFKAIGSGTRKLPTGQDLKDAFFILDDAQSTMVSKRWVKVQRPYLGHYGLVRGAKPNLRDITAIILTTRK